MNARRGTTGLPAPPPHPPLHGLDDRDSRVAGGFAELDEPAGPGVTPYLENDELAASHHRSFPALNDGSVLVGSVVVVSDEAAASTAAGAAGGGLRLKKRSAAATNAVITARNDTGTS